MTDRENLRCSGRRAAEGMPVPRASMKVMWSKASSRSTAGEVMLVLPRCKRWS